MAQERKKAEPKPIVKLEPKKRVQQTPIVEPTKTEDKVEETSEPKVKKSKNKYVRISTEAQSDERSKFAEKVKNGEIKHAFYATDGDKGYHYYLVIKK